MVAKKGMGRGIKFIIASSVIETDSCIEWPMYRMKNGYGQVGTEEGMKLAHRYSCEYNHGPPESEDLQAAHSCGNRAYINKRHLSWKTQTENEDDKHAHGTWFSRMGGAKLNEERVAEMRKRFRDGESVESVSQSTGVPFSTVRKVYYRETWKYVD